MHINIKPFTGSLANYNWSKFSDIDLHLILDYDQFNPSERELYKELFKLKKTLFNENIAVVFQADAEVEAIFKANGIEIFNIGWISIIGF